MDPQLKLYVPSNSLSTGTLKAVGSETLGRVMAFWSTDFQSFYPSLRIEVDARGSSNVFPALIAGQTNIGMMSRPPMQSEVREFKQRYGYAPALVPTSIDMLAVWVHKDNPVEGLSFPELDAIFSSTRKLGALRRARIWGDFVQDADFGRVPILCFGRNAASGTYGHLKETVLANGDYGPWVNELGGSSAVSRSVGSNRGAIGYSGIGFRSGNVKPLKISSELNGKLIAPTKQHALDGSYPLTRYLFLVINQDPRTPLDPVVKEFLVYVSSQQGQRQVERAGYVSLSAELVSQSFQKLIQE